MSKIKFVSTWSPYLFFVAAGLFYLNGFLTATSKGAYIALGTVFLVLGITALRRRSKKEQ